MHRTDASTHLFQRHHEQIPSPHLPEAPFLPQNPHHSPHCSLNTAPTAAASPCLPPASPQASIPRISRPLQTGSTASAPSAPTAPRFPRFSPPFLRSAAWWGSTPTQIRGIPHCCLHRSHITRVDCDAERAKTRDAPLPPPCRGRESAR